MSQDTQPDTLNIIKIDEPELMDAILEGGPVGMPAELRAQRVRLHEAKIKVSYYGGHEHFERVPDTGFAGAPVVFRWTGRTRMAE
jgi:hypothetical protein